jgi:hypothetical protein
MYLTINEIFFAIMISFSLAQEKKSSKEEKELK